MKTPKDLAADPILQAIMEHPKASDRAIAKQLGRSQPTVSRRRKHLEAIGFYYSLIPKFRMLGYEIIAVSEIPMIDAEAVTNQKVCADDNIIFAIVGVHKMLVMSKHKSFRDYAKFCRRYFITESYHASTDAGIIKNFTFRKP